jgi:uncharacterized protein
MPDPTKLATHLATFPSILVGYSGGVDSSLVAVLARRVLGRERAVAAMAVSPSFPAVQREQALAVAREFDLALVQVATHELDDPGYVANAPSRCYFCKTELWRSLAKVAQERGMAVVVDGTNLDDTHEHRPGLRAAAEHRVRSPLAEAGYTKADVRREARALGLPMWDAPAAPCLSSRILYGLSVTPARLRQVEAGEALLRAIGVRGDLRVRHRGEEARIEVAVSEFSRIRAHRDEIAREFLSLGFQRVALDLGGYRRGSLLSPNGRDVELLAART